MAVDAAGDLFIADPEDNRVLEAPAGGGAQTTIAPIVNGTGLNEPVGVAVDGAGDLFIADNLNSRVVGYRLEAARSLPSRLRQAVS